MRASRRLPAIQVLLYLRGLWAQDVKEVLRALLGEESSGLSPTTQRSDLSHPSSIYLGQTSS